MAASAAVEGNGADVADIHATAGDDELPAGGHGVVTGILEVVAVAREGGMTTSSLAYWGKPRPLRVSSVPNSSSAWSVPALMRRLTFGSMSPTSLATRRAIHVSGLTAERPSGVTPPSVIDWPLSPCWIPG
jgi:hypothetical protein